MRKVGVQCTGLWIIYSIVQPPLGFDAVSQLLTSGECSSGFRQQNRSCFAQGCMWYLGKTALALSQL